MRNKYIISYVISTFYFIRVKSKPNSNYYQKKKLRKIQLDWVEMNQIP